MMPSLAMMNLLGRPKPSTVDVIAERMKNTPQNFCDQRSQGMHPLCGRITPDHMSRPGLRETWQTPGTGWFQCDESVEVDEGGHVAHVAGGWRAAAAQSTLKN